MTVFRIEHPEDGFGTFVRRHEGRYPEYQGQLLGTKKSTFTFSAYYLPSNKKHTIMRPAHEYHNFLEGMLCAYQNGRVLDSFVNYEDFLEGLKHGFQMYSIDLNKWELDGENIQVFYKPEWIKKKTNITNYFLKHKKCDLSLLDYLLYYRTLLTLKLSLKVKLKV